MEKVPLVATEDDDAWDVCWDAPPAPTVAEAEEDVVVAYGWTT